MDIRSYTEPTESQRVFEIEIPLDEVDRARRGITRNYARRASIPGFRKGKVPESVVARKFADEIREELLENLIPDALGHAIAEKGIQPIGRPRIDDLKFEEGKPLAFRANVDVRPPIDPGDYSGLRVVDVETEPRPEEIEGALGRIRESHAEFLPVEARPARDGDYAIADVADRFVESEGPVLYTPEGNAIADEKAGEWHRDEKVTLEVGHAESMPEINEALRSALPGETRSFRKTFPPDFPNARYAGRTLDYQVTLAAIKEKRLPELDDAFASHVGEGLTLASLRDRIAENLRAEKQAARRRKFQREILDELVARVSIAAPEALVEAETESALEEYAGYLSGNGMDPKEADWDKLARDARPGAERRVKEYLVLDEIARRENLTASDTEVDAEIRASAARRGLEFDALRDRLVKEGRLGSVRQEIRLQKAVGWLVDHAQIEK
jgi:trigger factor